MGKKSKTKSTKKSNVKRSVRNNTVENISESQTFVAHAEFALSQMQIETALGYYEQALSVDASNSSIMDALADIYLSLGESGRAFELLQRSAQVSPEENPGKYLYIAQLQQNEDALSSYMQALHFLGLLRTKTEEELVAAVIDKQRIKAYCGIAELYLTDLCYSENAEQQCEQAISEALGMDPTSIDANHALANVRLSQSKPVEACALVETVYQEIHAIRERINARTVLQDLHAPEHTDFSEHAAEPDIPSLEICVSTVKMMLECSAIKPSLADDALVFSAELLNDDDENIELWYIAGVAAMTIVPPDFSVALYYLEQAKAMIEALRELPDFDDGAMNEHYGLIVDHISMIQSQQEGQSYLEAGGQDPPAAAAVAEEWSSDDEDEDDEGDSEGGGRMDM